MYLKQMYPKTNRWLCAMTKPTFAGRSASSTQKAFINEENGTGVYQFATGNTLDEKTIYTRVDYADKLIFQWSTDFRVISVYENIFQCRKTYKVFFTLMNFIWINVPQIALAYSENPNSICLSIQKLFKKQWRTFLKKSDISHVFFDC